MTTETRRAPALGVKGVAGRTPQQNKSTATPKPRSTGGRHCARDSERLCFCVGLRHGTRLVANPLDEEDPQENKQEGGSDTQHRAGLDLKNI
jgi:hypothetical protein